MSSVLTVCVQCTVLLAVLLAIADCSSVSLALRMALFTKFEDIDVDRDDFEEEPPTKKGKLQLKGKSKRFASPLKEKDMKRLGEGPIPANTAKNTQWALRAFQDWRTQRNKLYPKAKCPDNLLESHQQRT